MLRISSGFTLIEVMVSLALALIMMTIFAYIFQISGNFVTRQKGIAENDQSARILTTVLKTDFANRTMRYLAPYHPNMQALPGVNGDTERLGYFYYSENNPLDDTDDVLQFTVQIPTLDSTTQLPTTPLYGHAAFLPATWQANTNYGGANQITYVQPAPPAGPNGFIYAATTAGASGVGAPAWPTTTGATVNDGSVTWTCVDASLQPDGDDAVLYYFLPGQDPSVMNPATNPPITPNNTGASHYAEVTYFLRHGNLYRRVLLIREPYNQTTGDPGQPGNGSLAMINGLYTPAIYANGSGVTGNFWTDFDYGARWLPTTWQPNTQYNANDLVVPVAYNGNTYTCTTLGTSGATPPTWTTTPGQTVTDGTVIWTADVSPPLQFLSAIAPESSMTNTAVNPPPTSLVLSRPNNRFGFDHGYLINTMQALTANGTPREYAVPFNSQNDTIVGGTTPTPVFFGRYTLEETSNTLFQFPGALPQAGPVFSSPMAPGSVLGLDTTYYTMWLLDANPPANWTSFASGSRRGEDILLTNVVSFDVKLWDNNYSETAAGIDVNRNGIVDNGPAFADVGHTATGDFQQSNNIFPVYGPYTDTNPPYTVPGGGVWAPAYTYPVNGVNYNYNNVFDTWSRYFQFDNLQRAYDAADTNSVFAPAPYRPRPTGASKWVAGTAYTANQIVYSSDSANGYVYVCQTPGTSGTTDPFSLTDLVNGPAVVDGAGGLTWTVQYPANVQAIQITVKYLDPTQNLLRQVTIVQSLTQ